MGKSGIKKHSPQSKEYAKRLHDEKTLWTVKVVAYSQQQMLDAVAIVLYKYYDFTPEQQKEFHDRFEEKYAEINKIMNQDAEDGEYFEVAMENALKDAYGEFYVPRKERYEVRIADSSGNVWRV